MPVVNASVAAILGEIADLLDIQSANPFRVRAYRNAARTIGELGTDIKTLRKQGLPLTDIPGIGADLAGKIDRLEQEVERLRLDNSNQRRDNQALKDEIARLKHLPPRPPFTTSGSPLM